MGSRAPWSPKSGDPKGEDPEGETQRERTQRTGYPLIFIDGYPSIIFIDGYPSINMRLKKYLLDGGGSGKYADKSYASIGPRSDLFEHGKHPETHQHDFPICGGGRWVRTPSTFPH